MEVRLKKKNIKLFLSPKSEKNIKDVKPSRFSNTIKTSNHSLDIIFGRNIQQSEQKGKSKRLNFYCKVSCYQGCL